jgi:RAB protein geranylgeranyltransferase component A
MTPISVPDNVESSVHTHPTFFGYQQDHKLTFPSLLNQSRSFNIDSLPKLLLSEGKMVDQIVASSVGNYMEFKSIDALYFLTFEKKNDPSSALELQRLPGSKADIFNSKLISALEKRALMKVIQFAVDYGRRQEGLPVETLNENELARGRALLRPQNKDSSKSLSPDAQTIEQQPEKPFGEFLKETGVPASMVPFVTFGLGLQSSASCPSTEGLLGIYRHISASGRYGNTSFLVPVYGTSEFAQAFCRLSAVWGGIFILRESVSHFALSAPSGDASTPAVTSVKLSSGRTVNCDFVVCEEPARWGLEPEAEPRERGAVAQRHLLIRHSIFDKSLLPEEHCQRGVTVIPAHQPTLNNQHAIFVLQADSSLSVAPPGLYVVYFLTYLDSPGGLPDPELVATATSLMSSAVHLLKSLCSTEEVNELLYATCLHPETVPLPPNKNLPQNVFSAGSPSRDEHLVYIHETAALAEKIFKTMCPDSLFLSDPDTAQSAEGPLDPEEEGLKALLASAVGVQTPGDGTPETCQEEER